MSATRHTNDPRRELLREYMQRSRGRSFLDGIQSVFLPPFAMRRGDRDPLWNALQKARSQQAKRAPIPDPWLSVGNLLRDIMGLEPVIPEQSQDQRTGIE